MSMPKRKWGKVFAIGAVCLFLFSCSKGNLGTEVRLEEKLLGIELQDPVSQLRDKGLSKAQEQRLKDLSKELKALSKDIQKPLLQRARYANRNQAIALIFLNHGMYAEAQRYLDQAIEFESSNTVLFYYRALCAGMLMKSSNKAEERAVYLQQAKWDYERSLDIKPDYTDSLYGLAVLKLFEDESYNEAVQLLDRYIAKRNISKKAAQARGDFQPSKARTLREAQQRAKLEGNSASTKDINALFMRARAAYSLGNLNEAASFYDWVAGAAISKELRTQAEALKNQVLQENNYRADTP